MRDTVDEGRRNILKAGVSGAAGLAIGGAALYGLSEISQNNKASDKKYKEEHQAQEEPTPNADLKSSDEAIEKPLINKHIEKIARGEIQINKKAYVNGKLETLGVRRDTKVPVVDDGHSLVKWDDILSINGVDVSKAESFIVVNAPIVRGNPVDTVGREVLWYKFRARLKTGEEPYIYISRSKATSTHIQEAGSKEEPAYYGWDKEIVKPAEGLGVIKTLPYKVESAKK